MSQHDYVIANQTFPATRTDLNNAFGAIVSQNSGATAPSTTYAYQLWYDTTANKLKQRNADNDAWIDLFDVDQVADTATAAGAVVPAGSNLIINGACVIDQRNAGASVTPNLLAYPVDRTFGFGSVTGKFSCQQNSGSVTPPVGFSNYIGAVSLSAYSVGSSEQYIFGQPIEGLNVAHLAWGTSSASTVTLSFYVRSSLTGTFGGALQNSAFDRSYPFSYTISTANTWQRISITIVGDTSGTWLKTNGVGIRVGFSLGAGSSVSGTAGAWASGNFVSATGATSVVGTNAATFYITGIKLEIGSTATDFEHPRSYGDELARCDRYFQSYDLSGNYVGLCAAQCASSTESLAAMTFRTPMRASPSMSFNNLVLTDRIGYDSDVSQCAVQGSSSGGVSWRSVHASNSGSAHDAQHITSKNGTTDAYARFDAEL